MSLCACFCGHPSDPKAFGVIEDAANMSCEIIFMDPLFENPILNLKACRALEQR